ncbi:MAG: nucleoside hydrolase [Promethearchaeota archaeon]
MSKISSKKTTNIKKIIFDTDLALGERNKDVDDGLALIMALNSPEIEIVAVSAVFGNTKVKNAEKNIHTVLNLFSGEIALPEIILGASNRYDWDKKISLEGISRMAQIIQKHPSEITIVAIGPLTNIALLFHHHPETISLVKELVIMGGSINKWEFNFANDPNATDFVLKLPIPTTICGYETCCAQKFTKFHYEKLEENNTPRSRFLTQEIYSWFKLNWKSPQKLHLGRGFYPFDPVAVAYLLKPELFKGVLIPVYHDSIPSTFKGSTNFKFSLNTRIDKVKWAERRSASQQDKETWVNWTLRIESDEFMELLLRRLV